MKKPKNSSKEPPINLKWSKKKFLISRKPIGHGTFSVVYSSIDIKTKKTFAIKVFCTHTLREIKKNFTRYDGRDDLYSMIDEYRILEKLNDVNGITKLKYLIKLKQIVNPKYLPKNIQNRREFTALVFDLCDTNTFQFCFENPKFFKKNIGVFRKVGLKLMRTLKTIHDSGVIHGDISPSNIFIKDSKFYIGDFGNAITLDECKVSMENEMTTLMCRSPEKFNAKPFGKKIDVYSMGCQIFYMYTNQSIFPYVDGISNDVSLKARGERRISNFVSKFVDNDDLRDLILNMLRKKPKDRFTVEQCLSHQFFKPNFKTTRTLSSPTGDSKRRKDVMKTLGKRKRIVIMYSDSKRIKGIN